MSGVHVRRYTNLPALLYLLHERKITLLDPRSWDDENDSYYLALYAELKKYRTILALCFTQHTAETYHHWKIFADGPSGVCVIFNKERLLRAVNKKSRVLHRRVDYLKSTQIFDEAPAIDDLPFMKRYAFKHEQEYRLVYGQRIGNKSKLDIAIPLNCIERIILSPWMDRDIALQVTATIKAIQGFNRLEVSHSSLIGNDTWKAYGDQAAD